MSNNVLTVDYDSDGNRHYYRDGVEISEDVWMQQHPHMRKGNASGGDSFDSGRVGSGEGAESTGQADAESQAVQQDSTAAALRRARQRHAAAARNAGQGSDQLGQP